MIYDRDTYDNITPPYLVLCKGSQDRLGIIRCTEEHSTIKFNAYNELSFTTYMLIDGEKNPVYDDIAEMKYVEIPFYGRYVISNVNIVSEATDLEHKEVTALSEEVLLAQKYLELFTINMGTTESIDGVQFYNQADPEKSLLHLVLEKCPDWEIGHIDQSLVTMQRCFEVDRQDVYTFLTADVAESFGCIFQFNTVNHTINVYPEDQLGEDTDVFISYDNLAVSTNISSSIDDIKTCLTITGADDLSVREVNMGYDRIYSLDYFHTTDYMSQGLYDAYTAWKKKWDDNVKPYENLVTQYQEYYVKINEITSERMPDDPESTDWTKYGLNPLKEKLAVYQGQQAVMIKAGYGKEDSEFYESMYLPCYNTINAIEAQIEVVQKEIDALTAEQEKIGEQMSAIIEDIDMQKNFTDEQLKELTKFIREEELSSDNYVVTDTMTDSERMDMLREMLKYGQQELAKVSQPSLQFTLTMANIYANEYFNDVSDKFDLGNYIHVGLRDDYIIKARILTIDINLLDPSDFSATFSNIARIKGTQLFTEISEALKLAQSAATSVSFNSSSWNKANKEATSIGQMISDGLLAAGETIHTASSDIEVDDRGMFITNKEDTKYAGDGIFLGGGQILFTDDGFRTIRTALGRVQYTKKGVTYNDFGLLADFVLAGYIGGSYIEGNEFDNGNGTFHVDANGNLTATSATVKGKIQAESGYIGGSNGWTIVQGAIYSGSKSSVDSTADGTYLGAGTGINIGNSSKYLKYKSGTLTVKGTVEADSGHIGGTNGWTIATGKIYSGSKSSVDNTSSGTYLGTDGINIGSSSKYMKYKNGQLTIRGSIDGSTITGGSIEGAHITGGNGMFEVDDDSVYIGGFEARYDWGRDIFQSSDEQCGMSADPGVSGNLWFWAGYRSSNNFDFAVNTNGQVECKDLIFRRNGPDGGDTMELASTIRNILNRLSDLEDSGCGGDSCDSCSDCPDYCDSCSGDCGSESEGPGCI